MTNLIGKYPDLNSAGHKLDLSVDCFGILRSSAAYIRDRSVLLRKMENEGYLFLPGFLNIVDVINARKIVTERLAVRGFLDSNYPAIEAKSNFVSTVNLESEIGTNDNPYLNRIFNEGPLMEFMSFFLAGSVSYFEYKWFRTISPGKGTRPHSDIVYMGRGTKKLFTAWVPIGDVTFLSGGLMILEGSNNNPGISKYLQRDVDEYCLNYSDALEIQSGKKSWQWDGALSDNPNLLQKELGGRWLTTEYSPGDVVIFSTSTVHGSLDNNSEVIRLSADCRYQLKSEIMDERWIGANPIARGVSAKKGKIC